MWRSLLILLVLLVALLTATGSFLRELAVDVHGRETQQVQALQTQANELAAALAHSSAQLAARAAQAASQLAETPALSRYVDLSLLPAVVNVRQQRQRAPRVARVGQALLSALAALSADPTDGSLLAVVDGEGVVIASGGEPLRIGQRLRQSATEGASAQGTAAGRQANVAGQEGEAVGQGADPSGDEVAEETTLGLPALAEELPPAEIWQEGAPRGLLWPRAGTLILLQQQPLMVAQEQVAYLLAWHPLATLPEGLQGQAALWGAGQSLLGEAPGPLPAALSATARPLLAATAAAAAPAWQTLLAATSTDPAAAAAPGVWYQGVALPGGLVQGAVWTDTAPLYVRLREQQLGALAACTVLLLLAAAGLLPHAWRQHQQSRGAGSPSPENAPDVSPPRGLVAGLLAMDLIDTDLQLATAADPQLALAAFRSAIQAAATDGGVVASGGAVAEVGSVPQIGIPPMAVVAGIVPLAWEVAAPAPTAIEPVPVPGGAALSARDELLAKLQAKQRRSAAAIVGATSAAPAAVTTAFMTAPPAAASTTAVALSPLLSAAAALPAVASPTNVLPAVALEHSPQADLRSAAAPTELPRGPSAVATVTVATPPSHVAQGQLDLGDGVEARRETAYRALFDEFSRLRAECGEPAGLSFADFAGRLDSTRAAIIAQRGCHDVAFSAYIKNGRAALRAAPAP